MIDLSHGILLSVLWAAAAFFFVLVLPGYALCILIFAPRSISGTIRLFLSLALSLVISCIVGAVLIRIFGNLLLGHFLSTIGILSILFVFLGIARWGRTIGVEIIGAFSLRGMMDRARAWLPLLSFLLLITAVLVLSDRAARTGVTELYFTDPEAIQSEDAIARIASLPFEVHNIEGHRQIYDIQVRLDGNLLSDYSGVVLDNDQTWQGAVTVESIPSGVHTIEVVLFMTGNAVPYALIRLWVGDQTGQPAGVP